MSTRRLAILLGVTLGIGSSAAFAATLGVGSWHLWAGSQALTKGTCTVTGSSSTTDTYVDESTPASSFGSGTTLLVKPGAGARQWAFVRFDLSSCSIPSSGGADSASLQLVVTNAPKASRNLTVTPVLSTWSDTLTWTQSQSLSYGSALTTTLATGKTSGATISTTVTADVDALIKNGSANFGWAISDPGASGAQTQTTFGSSQNATAGNRPQLVINYEK